MQEFFLFQDRNSCTELIQRSDPLVKEMSWAQSKDQASLKVTDEMLDAEPHLALVSTDNVQFLKPWRSLQCSTFLQSIRENPGLGEMQEVKLTFACSATLSPVLDFCDHFAQEKMAPLDVILLLQVQPYYQNFAMQFTGDRLISTIKCAKYLGIGPLVSLLMAKATQDMCVASAQFMPSMEEMQAFKNKCAVCIGGSVF